MNPIENRQNDVYIHIAGLISATAYFYLASSEFLDYRSELNSLLIVMAICSAAMFSLFFCLRHKNIDLKAVIIWAILFRVIGIYSEPILEDDHYRYLWDGFIFAQTGNPYGILPADYFVNAELNVNWQNILDGINNPYIATVYSPVLEYLFLFSHWIQAGSLLTLKLNLLLADMCCIVILYRWTQSPYLLLYAWCPLLIKEVAFNAHPDILGVMLMLLCIHYWNGKKIYLSAGSLALAVACKPFAILILPLLIKNPRAIVFFTLCIGIIYLPFILTGNTEIPSLLLMYQDWEFNSSIYALVKLIEPRHVKTICLLILFGLFLVYWVSLHKQKTIPRGDYLYGGLLFLMAVANPWYAIWLLPFIAIYPSVWGWTTVSVISFAYITSGNMGLDSYNTYAHPIWLRPLEFGLIILAMLIDYYKKSPIKNSSPQIK